MHDFPGVVFRSEDAGNTKGDRNDLLPSADLGVEALYLHEVGKLRSFVLRHLLEASELAISVAGRGTLQPRLNRGPPARDGTKGVGEGTSSRRESIVL